MSHPLHRPPFFICLVAAITLASSSFAQLPSTRLGSIFPPGTKAGETVEVTIAGADLDDVTQLQFTHAGITAKQKTTEPGRFDKGPVLVQNQFIVTVAGNVPIGVYDARAVGKYGISNPRAFTIGDLTSIVETEPNNTREQATEITLPTTVSGQANAAADVDCYKFIAKSGQRLLVDCEARRIDSLMDAVVAVFDTTGRELDSSRDGQSGDPLLDFTAPADGEYFIKVNDTVFRGNNAQSFYFYRLSVGVLPHIDFVFPPAGQAGTNGQFTVYGRNLPSGQNAGLTIDGIPLQKITATIAIANSTTPLIFNSRLDPETAGLDGKEFRVKAAQGLSNPVLIGSSTEKIIIEKEPNNTPDKAQVVSVPCEIAGQFYPVRDEDWVTFEAKKGDVYSIEVISQRLGLPTDPSILLLQVTKDAEGKEQIRTVATVDDPKPPVGIAPEFDARNDDPFYRFEAPIDATYRLLVRDTYSKFQNDPRLVYRLIIRKEKPDFRLAAAPDGAKPSVLLRKGGNSAIRVFAYKQDGFAEPITVSVTGLPAGVTCPDVVIGESRNSATLILSAAENAAPVTGLLQIKGTAKVGNANVSRQARFGTAVWPLPARPNNNITTRQLSGEGRLARSIVVSVSELEVAPATITAGGGKAWETSRAGILKIPFTVVRRNKYKGNILTLPYDLPANIDGKQFTINGNTNSGEFQLNLKTNTPLGTYTFYLEGLAQAVSYSRNPEAAKAAAERKTEFEKINADAQAAAKAAATKKAAADKAATDTATAAKTATNKKTAAENAATQAAAALKAATDRFTLAKAAATKTPGDANLATASANAQKAVTDATAKSKAATDVVTAAQKALDDANAKLKVATDAKTVADKENEAAAELAKAAAAAKAVADKRATDTANAAKPANKNVRIQSTPVTIKVTPAPITITENKPATVKQGEKLEVPVAITRLYSYAEQVALATVIPGGVGGLQIPNVNIAKGQNQNKLAITAAANATPGTHQLTIRATVRLNNQNLIVDAPITLNVQKVEPKPKPK